MSTDLAVIEAALHAATPGPWFVDAPDQVFVGNRADGRTYGLYDIVYSSADVIEDLTGPAAILELANANLIANAPSWLAELVERVKAAEAAVVSAKADGWDERDRARASYLGPDHGHYEDCMGWEDCNCATYPNPYRALDGDAKRCTSDITLRDEEHRLCRCILTEGHAGVHDDGAGTTWTGGDA